MRFAAFIAVWIVALATVFQAFAQDRMAMQVPERYDPSKSVQVFPNPAVEFVHVRVDDFDASEVVLSLHNLIGNQVPVESEVIGEHEIRVRVKDLDAGYYLIALKDKSSRFRGTFKFVKK